MRDYVQRGTVVLEDFVNPVDDDLQCSICQSALRDPVLTRCGHRFCRGCLERHMSNRYVFDELNVKKLCTISQYLKNKENISFLLDNRISDVRRNRKLT